MTKYNRRQEGPPEEGVDLTDDVDINISVSLFLLKLELTVGITPSRTAFLVMPTRPRARMPDLNPAGGGPPQSRNAYHVFNTLITAFSRN